MFAAHSLASTEEHTDPTVFQSQSCQRVILTIGDLIYCMLHHN